MPLLGKRIREAEDALLTAKKLILKVKRMGIDTSKAEILYLEAKKNIRNKKYPLALKGIESARKTAKTAYAKGIKGMLEVKLNRLEELLKDLESKNLDSSKIKKDLKEGRSALEGGVKEFKMGYKVVKDGMRLAEGQLSKFNITSGFLATTRNLLRPMEDYNADISVVLAHRKNLEIIQEKIGSGKIESAEDEAKDLKINVEIAYKHFKVAYDSIKALEKVMSDAKVLGANIDYQDKFQEAQDQILKSKFKDASKIADWCTKQISELLIRYKEAKHDVDSALEKVKEIKSWGFSAYETEKILKSAQKALFAHDFESAKSLSAECMNKAQNIRERHKRSLELLQKAKDDVEKIKTKGIDTQNIENIISEAENEFNRGDYKATFDKLDEVFEAVSGLN